MNDIRGIIDQGRVTSLQISVFLICVLMNMLDGMDVLVIAYAAPALADAWSIRPGTLGTIFSAGLLGMTVGAMFLAPVADRIGRRRMIMICVAVMGTGTLVAAFAQSVGQLIFLRFASGLGIGAMLATAATMTAEYIPSRYRNFAVSAVFAGYPLGAVLTGVVAASVIPAYGWPAIFLLAGTATLLTIILVGFLLPESLEFLINARPAGALERVNRILGRMGHAVIAQLPPPLQDEKIKRASVSALFAAQRKISTPWVILLMFGLIGYGVQGGFVGLYAVAARLYPTEIRNTGIGWGIGAGRTGAIAGPKIGGTLVGMGLSMTANFMVFAVPLLVAAIATLLVKSMHED